MTVGAVTSNIETYTRKITSDKSTSENVSNKSGDNAAFSEMITDKYEKDTYTSKELYYQQTVVSKIPQIPQAGEKQEQMISLGIGFLFVGGIGMGMTANQIVNNDSKEVVIRVTVAKGGENTESYDINLSEVNPKNASAIEMFAFCQYADANGTGVDDKWGSWHALKQFAVPFGERLEYESLEDASNQKKDWLKALSKADYTLKRESTGEILSVADVFKMLKETFIEMHKLTPDNIEQEKDWREMDDEQWDKLIEQIDKYIEDVKERLEHMKEVQEEAARKAMAIAPADMQAIAASKAMLSAMAKGVAGVETNVDVSYLEKISWTYEMQTDDQVILAKAKMANEFASDTLSKSQEIALLGDTSVGISETVNVKECASLEEDENHKKVWTITAFTSEGIICTECPVDGSPRELWRIDYTNQGDAEKVWNYLSRFDKDADLKFARSKKFWEDFLEVRQKDEK